MAPRGQEFRGRAGRGGRGGGRSDGHRGGRGGSRSSSRGGSRAVSFSAGNDRKSTDSSAKKVDDEKEPDGPKVPKPKNKIRLGKNWYVF